MNGQRVGREEISRRAPEEDNYFLSKRDKGKEIRGYG